MRVHSRYYKRLAITGNPFDPDRIRSTPLLSILLTWLAIAVPLAAVARSGELAPIPPDAAAVRGELLVLAGG